MNQMRQLPKHMENYLKSQCRNKLEQADDIEKTSLEEIEPKELAKMGQKGKSHTDPFVCPIKDCTESFPSKY